MKLNFNYRDVEKYAKSLKLDFRKDMVAAFDEQAKAFKFTQAQVDCALQHHLIHVRHLFNPQAYRFTQRLQLAFFFLFGRV